MSREDDAAALLALAKLRTARAARRLGPLQARVEALRAEVTRLRAAIDGSPPTDVAEAQVHDRHAVWRGDRIRRLTVSLARAEADTQPLREAHAREKAREAVLARLAGRTGRRQFD